MRPTIGIDASRAFVDDRTGTEEYSYQIIRHLLRLPESKNYDFMLYVRPKAKIPDEFKKNNVSIRPINLRFLWTQVGLARASFADELSLLFVPAHTLPILGRRIPTVVTIHGLEYKWLKEYRNSLQRWYLPLSTYMAAKVATRVIAVSRATANDLVKETHINSNKIKVIHEGVELVDNAQARVTTNVTQVLRRYGLKAGKYLILVGSIQPRKNIPGLIEAFSYLGKRFPDYKLVIVGGLGWMAQDSFEAPSRWGVAEKVVFTGYVSQEVKQVLMSRARVYVQPSETEGFGLPVLEAMALQVPVVTSSGGALPEVVGEAGIVVPIGLRFAKKLGGALERVIASPQLRASLIKKGITRVMALTWEQAAQDTMRLFEEVIFGKNIKNINVKTKK